MSFWESLCFSSVSFHIVGLLSLQTELPTWLDLRCCRKFYWSQHSTHTVTGRREVSRDKVFFWDACLVPSYTENEKLMDFPTQTIIISAASLLSAMDVTVDPCEDFFSFACGNWNKKHLIPEDRSSISTFEVLSDQIQVILKGLLEEPINNLDSEATRKAKHFYISCMNLSESLAFTLFTKRVIRSKCS